MRVLMVTNIFPKPDFPGQGSFVKSQMESIQKEGVEVDLLSIDAKKSRWAYWKAWKEIRRLAKGRKYDLIHAHYGFSGIISRLQWRLPVLVSFCGGDILGNPDETGRKLFSSQIFASAGRLLSLTLNASIVKSGEMAGMLPSRKNVYVIPNGVDFQKFKPVPSGTARRKLGLPKRQFLVLFPSNATWPRKCYPVAEAAVILLRRRGWDVRLIPLFGKPQDLVPLYMSACNAMVLTSYWEGSPNVIKEAMACNLPIVSVDVGDVRQILSGCAGCFIIERNARNAADHLEKVFRANTRTSGREKIRHLEIQAVARKIIGIYKGLARPGVRRDS
ncbi:glycosyltransferase [bacterium]|nr:glycosyltransferase [bacterium]